LRRLWVAARPFLWGAQNPGQVLGVDRELRWEISVDLGESFLPTFRLPGNPCAWISADSARL
jgi:hypothetical protein